MTLTRWYYTCTIKNGFLTSPIPLYTVGMPMALEQELGTYQAKLPELKEHEGKFALIHGDEIVDFYSTYEDAIKGGYQRYKLEPFLVKRVMTTEPILFISRNIVPLHI